MPQKLRNVLHREVLFFCYALCISLAPQMRAPGQIEKAHTLNKKFFSFRSVKTLFLFFRISPSRVPTNSRTMGSVWIVLRDTDGERFVVMSKGYGF